jgi:hypothetical protein
MAACKHVRFEKMMHQGDFCDDYQEVKSKMQKYLLIYRNCYRWNHTKSNTSISGYLETSILFESNR